jgi:hypothetical protein
VLGLQVCTTTLINLKFLKLRKKKGAGKNVPYLLRLSEGNNFLRLSHSSLAVEQEEGGGWRVL